MARKLIVKRIGVLSFAKVYAVLMAFVGLLVGLIWALILLVAGAAVSSVPQQQGAANGPGAGSIMAMGAVGALMIVIFAPIFYGVIGFVFGAIGAALFNLAAGVAGGLEMDVVGGEAVPGPYDKPGSY
jgi:hypothetical protein